MTSSPPPNDDALDVDVESGRPLAYVRGRVTFLGVDLEAASGALVPRKETELLGETAIALARKYGATRVVDMCCGAGNLACAIATHVPSARVWASDLTEGCVDLARRNVARLGLSERVSVVRGDLFAPLMEAGVATESIDLVVCNPPYISSGKLAGDHAALLDHEPREAFDGGPYGLSIHQRVVKEALAYLAPGGWLVFEIGAGQDRQLQMLFTRAQAYRDFEAIKNDAGYVRCVLSRKVAATPSREEA